MQSLIEQVTADFYPENAAPGCAVLAIRGEETFMASRGVANLESGESITSKTNFRLASVSKQFTAACVLQLRDKGALRLDQPVTDFFPTFEEYGQAIEIEHLLRHTSGVKDYEKLIPENLDGQLFDEDVLKLVAAEQSGDFAPGQQFRYSNTGYALLAMIVEAVSGSSYPDYLREKIFDPLDMTGTMAYVNKPGSPQPSNRAIGYSLNDGKFAWADQNQTTAVLGDGGIYCSTSDYEKWIRGYFAGKVLSPDTVAEAWRPGKTNDGEDVPYGYGWRLEKRDDGWRPYHPGSTSGFRNGVILDPERGRATLVLSNRCNGDALALASALREIS